MSEAIIVYTSADAAMRKRTRLEPTTSDEEPDQAKWTREDKPDGVAVPQNRRKRQTAVSDYFKPGVASVDELIAQLNKDKVDWVKHFSSPVLDKLLNQEYNPCSFSEWLVSIGAKDIDVPANGACFWYALHALKAR